MNFTTQTRGHILRILQKCVTRYNSKYFSLWNLHLSLCWIHKKVDISVPYNGILRYDARNISNFWLELNAITYRIRLSNMYKREEGACLKIKKKIEKIKRKYRIQFFCPRLSFPESRLSQFVFYTWIWLLTD